MPNYIFIKLDKSLIIVTIVMVCIIILRMSVGGEK